MASARTSTIQALCLGLAVIAPAQAGGIIMRDDVPDARYRDFGEHYRSYVVQLAVPGGKPGAPPLLFNGIGTMIAPRWVLTAAHAADRFVPGAPNAVDLRTHAVFVNGRGHRILRAFVHPDFRPPDSNSADTVLANDLALLLLEDEVKDASIACLYDGTDELGKRAILAGTGIPGNGLKGPGKPDGALRGSTVTVDAILPGTISWTFRGPKDPKATPLEGISGPGDSGGPAFIERKGELCIAGISSTQDTKGGPEGLYGVTEHYTRVSSHLDWIRKVMRDNP
jgi:hypothetical protein